MLSDFGETVAYTPLGGSSVNIVGIFDNAYQAVESGGSVSFALQQPRLTVRSSDVPGVQEGDGIILRSTPYNVAIVMDDGTGITELALEAQ